MSKYDKFRKILTDEKGNEVCYSIEEIKEKLDILPDSAMKNRGFWSNDITHPQAKYGWLKLGWEVRSVDMDKKKVCFFKPLKKPDTSTNQVISTDFSRTDLLDKLDAEYPFYDTYFEDGCLIFPPELYEALKAGYLKQVTENGNKEIPKITSAEFDNIIRPVLSKHYKNELFAGQISGIPNLFALVQKIKRS